MRLWMRHLRNRAYRPGGVLHRGRQKRMQEMVRRTGLRPGQRVLDLGGTPYMWEMVDHGCSVTLVNLPSARELPDEPWPGYELIEADACELEGVFADLSFDLVFSNSVIEHVGGEARQVRFAAQVRRLAPAYWIQTPSPRFPVEAHSGTLFYWQRSAAARDRLHDRWRETRAKWYDRFEGTRVLSGQRLMRLFPGASIYPERVFGFEKSIAAYRPALPGPAAGRNP